MLAALFFSMPSISASGWRYPRHRVYCADPAQTNRSMHALYNLFDTIIRLYVWLLVASVVLSWLVSFGVVNRHNQFVYTIGTFLERITEPILRPVRNLLPNMGGLDISPIVVILALYFLRDLAFEYLRP